MHKTDDELVAAILHGQVKKHVWNERGGFFLIWSEGGRFRADASKFQMPPVIGALVSFLPDHRDSNLAKTRLRRIYQIVFEPETKEKIAR